MSFHSVLEVEGKSYTLRRFYASIFREEDEKGRPKSDPTWRLNVLVDSSSEGTLTNWMVDPQKKIDGKIILYKEDGSKLKEIEFKKSSCFKLRDFFNEEFSFTSTFLGISGKDIKTNSAELVQSWPGT